MTQRLVENTLHTLATHDVLRKSEKLRVPGNVPVDLAKNWLAILRNVSLKF